MKIRRGLLAAWIVAPLALFASTSARADATRSRTDEAADHDALARLTPVPFKNLCEARPGRRHCMAKVVTNAAGTPLRDLRDFRSPVMEGATPQGLAPADLHAAYGLPMTGGGGKTVAVIDAFDAPNAESDLAIYRAQYGLPACTAASGCFTKVDENGGTNLPPTDGQGTSGWEGEIMLDIEMISAVCPDCKILLVEAPSDSADFAPSLATAAKLGAAAISNSYGQNEDTSIKAQEAAYDLPGVLVTASAGDSGFGPEYPATSAFVMAVGGTKLTASGSSRGWAESAWAFANGGGTGSGCSGFIAKPSYQTDANCAFRMESDISAVADPATGVATYDQGWEIVGGTSASSPIVASAFVLLGLEKQGLDFPYKHSQAFNDVTSGTNDPQGGSSCNDDYQCVAAAGYDGPTGWGTPNGAALAKLGTSTSPDAGTSATVDAGSSAGAPSSPKPGGGSDAGVASSGAGAAPGSGTTTAGGTADDAGSDSKTGSGSGTAGGGYAGGNLQQGSQSGCAVARAPGTSSRGEGAPIFALAAMVTSLAVRRRRARYGHASKQ